MDTQKTRTWAEVSLEALRHNAIALQKALPEGCGLMGVVKADGYGHGAAQVARTLHEAGARYLAVACPEEALALRNAGETMPILILGAVDPAWAPILAENGFTQTVECREKGEALSGALRPGQKLTVHIKLDTGMGRIGFRAVDEQELRAAASVMLLPNLVAEGVFTHFSVSDTPGQEEYTRRQFRLFREAADTLEKLTGRKLPIRHCANSGAVQFFRGEGFCQDLVRPGLLTYGLRPEADDGSIDLIPAMELKSRVAAVTHHKKGDTISYGRIWTAERDCTLAVLPIGYADGLQRCLSGKLEVELRGHRVRQVGRICMDVCMLDVTDIPDVCPGDVATVFGRADRGAPTANDIAALAETIPYEILCGVSPRVPRVYIR